MAYQMTFSYDHIAPVEIPDTNLLHVIKPNDVQIDPRPVEFLVQECLRSPLGAPRLKDALHGDEKVLILLDDYTRMTPADEILPVMLDEIAMAGVRDENISILIASGTHRRMTDQEKQAKCGKAVTDRIRVYDHVWYEEDQLTFLGVTENGTEIHINKMLVAADFIIGIGHIVPHRVAGYSGGAKIVQPGVCGDITTGQTHWLSALKYTGREIIGNMDNPVRLEINSVGEKAGLKFIFNTVHAGNGHIYTCVCGDPYCAFKAGCRAAEDVYGSEIESLADIVISDAYPSSVNMWQSSKGIYSADLALKEDGVLILVSPCPEGVAMEHPEVSEFGYSDPAAVEELVSRGEMKNLTVAAHILHVGKVISGKRRAIIVSPGISSKTAEHLGFIWAENADTALSIALEMKGREASVTVLEHGGEVMPILTKISIGS